MPLPNACTSAASQFYLRVRSNDPSSKADGTLKVQVPSPSGQVPRTLATYSAPGNDPSSKAHATLKVQVPSPSGQVPRTLATYSGKNARNSYFRHSFSPKSCPGRTIIQRLPAGKR